MKPLNLASETKRRCRSSFDELRASIRDMLSELVMNTLGYSKIPVGDDTFDVGLMLACAVIQTGPHAIRISNVTGLPRQRCCWWGIRARRFGVFGPGGVYADPWALDDQIGAGINFLLDAMVVAGVIGCKGPRGDSRLYFSV